MNKHLEIEYKSFISEKSYNNLMNYLNLKDKIFIQTNYYFDTINKDLFNNKIVLRIRNKENQYKLTKKSPSNNANLEESIYLNENEALSMIKNGFDASLVNINLFVKNICTLKTYRAKIEYKDGILFLDKSEYNGIIDYEIEYEANNIDFNESHFKEILKELKIDYKKSYSKYKRCIESLKK